MKLRERTAPGRSGDATPSWERKTERGSTLGIRVTLWFYRTLGRQVAGLLLYPIVGYFFLSDAAARRASREYLRRLHATPDGARALGSEPAARHVFRHLLEFGRAILDRAGFWLSAPGFFRFQLTGEEELARVVEEKRGAVVLGAHLGSFEALRVLATIHAPIPVHLLMYTHHATRINAILEELERAAPPGGAPVRVIEIRAGSFRHVTEAKACIERGEVVAILADRLPAGEAGRSCRVDFLGGQAELPQGPFRLAALLGCPVLVMVALRASQRCYDVHVERFADRIELGGARRGQVLGEYAQAYADRLAHHCVRAPYQWFNFYPYWKEGDADGAG